MEIEEVSNQIVEELGEFEKNSKIRMVLVETLTNAFFYGARNEDPSAKFNWDVNFVLEADEQIEIQWTVNADRFAVSVKDFGGKLNSNTLLHWLNRQTTPGDSGLPLGIYDTHGRGLFISRKLMDHFFINVQPSQYSECLMIAQKNPLENNPHKDISFKTYF